MGQSDGLVSACQVVNWIFTIYVNFSNIEPLTYFFNSLCQSTFSKAAYPRNIIWSNGSFASRSNKFFDTLAFAVFFKVQSPDQHKLGM